MGRERMSFTRSAIESVYHQPFIDGNRVHLLWQGTDSMESIMAEVGKARQIVCVQFYIYRADESGMALADLLKAKAREGVAVYVLYDHYGSFGTPRAFWAGLRDAGVHVAASHPLRLGRISEYTRRDHRKLLIVDGTSAFTGGLNIGNEYLRRFRLRRTCVRPWRDTGLTVTGPVAHALYATFQQAWRRWSTVPIDAPIHAPAPAGTLPVLPIFAQSGHSRRRMRRLIYYSINHAQTEISLTTAYFTPSRRLLVTLEEAAARGVRVRLLVPEKSDIAMADYAGRRFFARLIRAGVEVYTYGQRMLHAKTYVFDRAWCIVGSANLGFRSFRWNDEGNVGILDRGFASRMTEIFEKDLSESNRIDLAEWARRPLWQKALELLSSLIRRRI
jgi:cardiolipin synthase